MQDDGHDGQDAKTGWAEARTDWAEDRTMLANERTFAGWMRTGMASVAVAIGLRAVIGDFEPSWIAQAVSSLFVAIAVIVFWSAWHNACTATDRLNEHRTDSHSKLAIGVIAGLLAVAAIGAGALLWFL